MFRGRKSSSLIPGLLLLCALPALGREPVPEGEARVVAAVSRTPAPQMQQRLDKLFTRWETYQLDLPALERQVRETGRVTLQVGDRAFTMELELNDLRAPGYQRVRQTRRGPVREKAERIGTYKGHLAGDPESSVRLLILPGLFQGYIRTADEWIFIDPLRKYGKSSTFSEIVLFDDGDVRAGAESLCGSGELAHSARELIGSRKGSEGVRSQTAAALISAPTLGQADIATDADYEYYLVYGSSTNSQIQGIINQVDGIYQAELALTLQITYQNYWTSTSSPYPYTSSNHQTLLNQFAVFWNVNRTSVSRDLAHLFTGKNLGGIGGVAYRGYICYDLGYSYGLSIDHSDTTKIVAHEIGHNFDAAHDDAVSPPAASCSGSGPIMCSVIQSSGPDLFSDFSKATITTHVNDYGSCLDRLSMTYYTGLTSQTPDTTASGTGYEAGNQFSSSQDGYITALRFWKACGETGTHVGRLWTNSGVELANVTFTSESSCGWQEEYLPFRVKISAYTYYWVTYNESSWQSKAACGLSSPITNGPLTVWGGAYSNANSSGTFPTNGSCSNFFADVYFTP